MDKRQDEYNRVKEALAALRKEGKSRFQIYFAHDLVERDISKKSGNGKGDRHPLAQFTDNIGLKKNGNTGKV